MGGKPHVCTGLGACGYAAPVLAATDPPSPALQCKSSPTSLPSRQRGQNLPPASVRAQDFLRRLPHHAGRQHPDQSPRGGQHPPETAGERGWDCPGCPPRSRGHACATISCCPQMPTGVMRCGAGFAGPDFQQPRASKDHTEMPQEFWGLSTP